MSFRDNFGNEYEDTYIPEKIVGFIGIDPDIKNRGGGVGGTDNHEELTNLLGGDATGHWHMTKAEHDKLASNMVLHEELPDLQGGNEFEHFHLTHLEHVQLLDLIKHFLGYPAPDDNDENKVSWPDQVNEIKQIFYTFIPGSETSMSVWLKNNHAFNILRDEDTFNALVDARIAAYMNQNNGG